MLIKSNRMRSLPSQHFLLPRTWIILNLIFCQLSGMCRVFRRTNSPLQIGKASRVSLSNMRLCACARTGTFSDHSRFHKHSSGIVCYVLLHRQIIARWPKVSIHLSSFITWRWASFDRKGPWLSPSMLLYRNSIGFETAKHFFSSREE